MKTAGRVAQVVALVLLLLFPHPSYSLESDAGTGSCQWMQTGPFYSKFVLGDQQATYRLSTKGKTWKVLPTDLHSQGYLWCDDCADGHRVSGHRGFGCAAKDQTGIAQIQTEGSAKWLQTDVGVMTLSMRRTIRSTDLITLYARDNITVNRFHGYSALYKFRESDYLKRRLVESFIKTGRLLVLRLTDGNIEFETVLSITRPTVSGQKLLDSLLEELVISSTRIPLNEKQRWQYIKREGQPVRLNELDIKLKVLNTESD